jgi:spore coat protein U-like protein
MFKKRPSIGIAPLRRSRVPRSVALAGLIAILAPWEANAATDSDTMTVTATVISSCGVTANDMAFGNYDPVDTSPLDAATTIDVICTNGTPYIVSLDPGIGSGATIAARKMSSGGDTLTYSLYRDASRTLVWGQTNSVNNVAGAGVGAVQSLNVYGRAPTNQTAPVGSYSDTVTVTVSY